MGKQIKVLIRDAEQWLSQANSIPSKNELIHGVKVDIIMKIEDHKDDMPLNSERKQKALCSRRTGQCPC